VELPHLQGVSLPRLHAVRQRWPRHTLPDLSRSLAAEWARPELAPFWRPGLRVAIAVGSRGIARLPEIVASLVRRFQAAGCVPFIIPAMGSHGGATAAGQQEVLAHLGITAAAMGCPVRASMSTVPLAALHWDGQHYAPTAVDSPGAIVLHGDALAFTQADIIVPVVRIKPHTGFRGDYESGICKMLSIGLGKHATCARLHREGYTRFGALIPAAARPILATQHIAFAVAVVEDAYDSVAMIEAVPAAQIMAREPELLHCAKEWMPSLPFRDIDVLVIEQIGKDISGTGMDPNITGRMESGPVPQFSGPRIQRIVVLGLSAAAQGNATGLGLADVITESCFCSIDRTATAINVLTSGSLNGGRIPVAVAGEEQAILAAAACIGGRAVSDARIVRIRSTLHLEELQVSPTLLAECADFPHLELHDGGDREK